MEKIEGLSFIDLQESTSVTGHSNFHSNPAASSDLIPLVRYGFAVAAADSANANSKST